MRTSSIGFGSLTAVLALASTSTAAAAAAAHLKARQAASSTGYTLPTDNGGTMLTTTEVGRGEPINVIISGNSDAGVLTDQGIQEYFASLYYSPGSCAGITIGNPQRANLGDGAGLVNQSGIVRFNYYQGQAGTCVESLRGGNHARYWKQAESNAYFLAASVEMSAAQSHMIVPDGYNMGRDWIVNNATNASTTSPGGFTYQASTSQVPLLQGFSASDINHDIATDGQVSVLTVKITKSGTLGATASASPSSGSSGSGASLSTAPAVQLAAVGIALSLGALTIVL